MNRIEYRECLAECFEEAASEIEENPEYRHIHEAYQESAASLRAGQCIEESLDTIDEVFTVLREDHLDTDVADNLGYRLQAFTAGLTVDAQGRVPKIEDIDLGVMSRLAQTGESRGGPEDALYFDSNTPAPRVDEAREPAEDPEDAPLPAGP